MKKVDSNRADQEYLESFENGEWQSVGNLQRELRRYQESAAQWLEKNMTVCLTLPADDFARLKQKANKEGVPYQALLANLVHQFVTRKS